MLFGSSGNIVKIIQIQPVRIIEVPFFYGKANHKIHYVKKYDRVKSQNATFFNKRVC
jgi:hypothetical protein